MKVLVINTVTTRRNGITNVIFNLLEHQHDKSIVFDFMAINEADHKYVKIIKDNGGAFFVIKRRELKIKDYIKKLRDLIVYEKYDVVHVHGNSHTVFLELLISRLAGCKHTIVHAHASTSTHKFLHYFMSVPFFILYDKGIACSKESGKWMFGNKKYYLLHNAVDSEKFRFSLENREKVYEKLQIKESEIVLCHVGMFDKNKNQAFLLNVLKHVKNSNVRLLLLGDGDEKESVKNLANELKLNNVCFIGLTDNVDQYLSAADLFLMPSHYEGFPLSLIEAQANGLLCIVSDTITQDINITGNTSFLSINNALMWAKSIKKISIDDRIRLSDDSINKIKERGYDIDVVSKEMNDIYHECLS